MISLRGGPLPYQSICGDGGEQRQQAMPNQCFHQAGRAAPGRRELVRFLIERDANEM